MKKYEFNYSKKFNCIGRACKHNCCLGWEISIDKKTRALYDALSVSDSRFSDSCFKNGGIVLNENARCPFLDEDNLCHVIKNYGEKALSRTCKTHPRFVNYFSTFTETGLGLYCEHACRIILTSKAKMKPVLVKKGVKKERPKGFEKSVLKFRKTALGIICDPNLLIEDRLNKLLFISEVNIDKKPYKSWVQFFYGLEQIKTNENYFLKLLGSQNFMPIDSKNALYFEQILSYLAFRHLSRAIDEIDLSVRLAFIVLSAKVINQIFYSLGSDLDALIEACRFYTSTIELSEDNLFSLLNEVEKCMTIKIN